MYRIGTGAESTGRWFLWWRLPALLSTAILVGWMSPSLPRALALAFPLIAGMLALHLFSEGVLERWASRGHILVADSLLISLALLGVRRIEPSLFVALFAVILLAVVTTDRLRTIVGSCLVMAAVAALRSRTDGAALGGVAMVQLPYLLCVAISFGTVAEQMVRRRREDPTRREAHGLWALLEITETIGSTLEVAQVMRAIVQRVGDLVETESCSILLADEEHASCFVVASKGHPDVDMLELDLSNYPEVRRALESGEPVIVNDVEENALVAPVREILLEKGYRSLAVLPLLYGKQVLGTLFLRARRERPFSDEELRFCKVAAGASANALKNALLYRDAANEAEQHRATGEKLRRVLDATPDMIVATDAEGRVTEFNRGAERLTGLSAVGVVGRPLTEIFGARAGSFGNGPGERQIPEDVVFARADGEQVEISPVSAPLSGRDGEPAGRVWIGRDVSKLRRVESNLIQAERLSSLGEVVAGVAHELNNPLSGVVGYAQLLRVDASEPSQIRDLDRIVESALRCQKIVVKLLSFARKRSPEKGVQNLNSCVTKVLDLKSYQLRSSQIDTVLELDAELPDTCFDFYQIEQVLLNLLNNAEQAIASVRVPGRIVLRTGVRGSEVYLEIEDNGPGVPTVVRPRIFDPFFTTKSLGQGTGLGLSVSYGIVHEHGGRLELEAPREGGGARFTLHLPLIEGPAQEKPQPTDTEPVAHEPLVGCRVLLADDDPLVLELLTRVLVDARAEVTQAADGEQAWDELMQSDFDLIVADLRMPGVSGQELYERIAAERPNLLRRFVFATGDLVRPETTRFLDGLPNRILAKPLEVATVLRVLSQARESLGAAASPAAKV